MINFQSRALKLLLLAVFFAGAGTAMGGKDAGLWPVKDLNLTEKQKEQVRQINKKYRPLISEQRKLEKAAKDSLVKDLQVPQHDAKYNEALREKFLEVQKLKQAHQLQKFEMALEIRQL